jgi:hypothetical protein
MGTDLIATALMTFLLVVEVSRYAGRTRLARSLLSLVIKRRSVAEVTT